MEYVVKWQVCITMLDGRNVVWNYGSDEKSARFEYDVYRKFYEMCKLGAKSIELQQVIVMEKKEKSLDGWF